VARVREIESAVQAATRADQVVLGRAVREQRARRGLSQEELGARAGIHRNYVGAIERGEVNTTFRSLVKVARGLDTPLSAVMRLYELRLIDP
jgi:transcriptional regulator with XRE-family HTH domain